MGRDQEPGLESGPGPVEPSRAATPEERAAAKAPAPARKRSTKLTAEVLLAAGLAATLIILSVAVLVGVANGQRDLSELGVRVLNVAIAAAAGALGYQIGRNGAKKE